MLDFKNRSNRFSFNFDLVLKLLLLLNNCNKKNLYNKQLKITLTNFK